MFVSNELKYWPVARYFENDCMIALVGLFKGKGKNNVLLKVSRPK